MFKNMTQRLKFLLLVLVLVFAGYLLTQGSKQTYQADVASQLSQQSDILDESENSTDITRVIHREEVLTDDGSTDNKPNDYQIRAEEIHRLSIEKLGYSFLFSEKKRWDDFRRIYKKMGQVYISNGGEYVLIEGADPNTFTPWDEVNNPKTTHYKYYKDDNQIWYYYTDDASSGFDEMRELNGININRAKSIKIGDFSFITDGELIFDRGMQLIDANPKNLKHIGGWYYTDDVFVYLLPRWEGSVIRLDQADPATFQIETKISVFPDDPRHDSEYATPFGGTGYAYDKNSLYYDGIRIGSSDGYRALNYFYRKTNEAVYALDYYIPCYVTNNIKVKNADPETFQLFPGTYQNYRWSGIGFDKKHVFAHGKLQERGDPSTLVLTDDKNYIKDLQGNSWPLHAGPPC